MRFAFHAPLVVLVALGTSGLAAGSERPARGRPIRVQGNQFVDAAGTASRVPRRGARRPRQARRRDGHWTRRIFQEVRAWGANIVRLPVHPAAWRARGRRATSRCSTRASRWAREAGLYVLLDWHVIGNLRTELMQDPMYDTTRKETFEFWRTLSQHYRDDPMVVLYELFNEPTDYDGRLGRLTWAQWKPMLEEMIGIVRANDPTSIVVVAGLDWAYELREVMASPVDAPGGRLRVHPYPQKRAEPWEPKWEADWGHVAVKYPVFVTELGFERKGSVPFVGTSHYGRAIVGYMEKRGISWAAWCFDVGLGADADRGLELRADRAGSPVEGSDARPAAPREPSRRRPWADRAAVAVSWASPPLRRSPWPRAAAAAVARPLAPRPPRPWCRPPPAAASSLSPARARTAPRRRRRCGRPSTSSAASARSSRDKTVTVKVNFTGWPIQGLFGRTAGETYVTHGDTALALARLLSENGARRIRFVESRASRCPSRTWWPRRAGTSRALQAISGVEFENTRNLGHGSSYARLDGPRTAGGCSRTLSVNHSYADTDVFVSLCKMKEHATAAGRHALDEEPVRHHAERALRYRGRGRGQARLPRPDPRQGRGLGAPPARREAGLRERRSSACACRARSWTRTSRARCTSRSSTGSRPCAAARAGGTRASRPIDPRRDRGRLQRALDRRRRRRRHGLRPAGAALHRARSRRARTTC